MKKLRCHDYGFECDYEVEGDEEFVITEFRQHTFQEHGIDYDKEALMQFIQRKHSTQYP